MAANDTPTDGWTAVHFAAGFAAARFGVRPLVAASAAVVYEMIEMDIESHPAGQAFFDTPGPEIPENQRLDIIVFGLGYVLGAVTMSP